MEYSLELIKIISYLLVVLALFYLVVKFLRRQSFALKGSGQIKVIEKFHLTTDKAIYLIKVANQVWLVTSTKEGINFVREVNIEDIEDIDDKEKVNLLNFFKKGKE